MLCSAFHCDNVGFHLGADTVTIDSVSYTHLDVYKRQTIHRFLSFAHGGGQQIAARIAYKEIDMVLCFGDPNQKTPDARCTLLDSLGKRVDCLKEVQTDRELSLIHICASSLLLPISQGESCSTQPRKSFEPEALSDLADSIRILSLIHI